MPVSHETTMFDVNDFKVWPMTADTGASPTYGAAVDVPGIAQVGLDPNIVTAVLKGDARVMARKGKVDQFNITATYGKLDLDVLEVILGGEVNDDGTTPNMVAEWTLPGVNALPYFKAAFQILDLDVGIGSVRAILYKAQVSGGTLLGQSSDEFGQPTVEIGGIPADSDPDIFISIFIDETATALT